MRCYISKHFPVKDHGDATVDGEGEATANYSRSYFHFCGLATVVVAVSPLGIGRNTEPTRGLVVEDFFRIPSSSGNDKI